MESEAHSTIDALDEDQCRALHAHGTEVHFPAEQAIFLEGQPSRSVLVIDRGHVKVTRQAADGAEVILAIRGPGEVMGDEGVLMGEVRSATVTTITEVAGIDIAADELLSFIEQESLWPVMYRAAVWRRRESDQQALLARLGVRSRLARWLLDLATEFGIPNGGDCVLDAPISQHDLANRIGASRDAVALALRQLREQGLVSTGRRQITLHDLQALQRLTL